MNLPVQFGVSDMERMARALATSKLFGVQNPDQALALCLIAQAEGRHPASAAADYHIISGRPAKKAEAMLRDFIASGGKVKWHALSDELADATFTHPQGGEVRITWDMERKKQAGINNPQWTKYPRQMLRSRCVSEGVRTVCPAATSGMYVPEEQEDITPTLRDVTPGKTPADALPEHPRRQTPAARALSAQREESDHSDDPDDLPPESPRYTLEDAELEGADVSTLAEATAWWKRVKAASRDAKGDDAQAWGRLLAQAEARGAELKAAA